MWRKGEENDRKIREGGFGLECFFFLRVEELLLSTFGINALGEDVTLLSQEMCLRADSASGQLNSGCFYVLLLSLKTVKVKQWTFCRE